MNTVKKRAYEDLSEVLRKKLLETGVARYTLKGSPNPMKEALQSYLKKPRRYRHWRLQVWANMTSIDKRRKELGLKPLYEQHS